jgi:hypothetical protein
MPVGVLASARDHCRPLRSSDAVPKRGIFASAAGHAIPGRRASRSRELGAPNQMLRATLPVIPRPGWVIKYYSRQ